MKSISELPTNNDTRKKRLNKAIKRGIEIGNQCCIDGNKNKIYEISNIYWGSYDNDDDTLILYLQGNMCSMGWNALSERLELYEEETQTKQYNVVLQAIDDKGNLFTWKYYTIKDYLMRENHIYKQDNYKFYKATVNGVELEYSDIYPKLMRNVSDFKTYCRSNVDQKEIKTEIDIGILHKFLLEESEHKRKNIFVMMQKGQNIDGEYKNEGGSKCEYRPGHIEGYDFLDGKGIKISWINKDVDICEGFVTRSRISKEIANLISKGVYLSEQKNEVVKIQFIGAKQVQGQMNIFDFI